MRRQFTAALFALFPAIGFCQAAAPQPQEDLINADRPGIADGSNVIGKGHSQIELGAQWETHDSGGASDRRFFVPALLRLGLSDKWELRSETSGIYATQNVEVLLMNPTEFAAKVKRDHDTWGKLIRDAGLKSAN